MYTIQASLIAAALLLQLALGAPTTPYSRHLRHARIHLPRRNAVITIPASAAQVGVVTDSGLNRDSCGSVKIDGRVLWTCRDTQTINSLGLPDSAISASSSASWTNVASSSSPALSRVHNDYGGSELSMYGVQPGASFFPIPSQLCGDNQVGSCPDGTRYSIWPDSPPLAATVYPDGGTSAYTWIRASRIYGNLTTVDPDPATILYRCDYLPANAPDALPAVTMVNETFWSEGDIPYGAYGNVIDEINSIAYLYGQPSSGVVALAKVPLASIADATKYQYYVNDAWTSTKPSRSDPGVDIPNASAGGQGTYYYSSAWSSYVWIGQASYSVTAKFFITTAPHPTGPWSTPTSFFQGSDGNSGLSAYSLQAHPALVQEGVNEIWLSHTKTDTVGDDTGVYTTVLSRVAWK